MRLDELELRIEDHAYERYCQRVESITKQALIDLVTEQLMGEFYRRRDYIQMNDVWWRYSATDGVLRLYTCYGKHQLDLPAAIQWAKQHKDRIVLGQVYGD